MITSLLKAILGVGMLFEASSLSVDRVHPATVGLGGGLELTIIGEGFSGDEFLGANLADVGGQECKVMQEFATQNRIVCERVPPAEDITLSGTPMGSSYTSPGTVRQPVNVNVDGRWITRSVSLQYAKDQTPVLHGLGHASVFGGRLPFRGKLLSRFPTQYRVLIDDVRCSVLEQLEENNVEAFSEEPGAERHFFCSPQEQEAGFYNITVSIEPDLIGEAGDLVDFEGELSADHVGSAIPSQGDLPQLYKASFITGAAYMVAHYPSVTSIYPQSGSTMGGTVVTITGSGFSSEIDNNVVKLGSQTCQIKSASLNQLEFVVPSLENTESEQPFTTGFAGLMRRTYKLRSAPSEMTGEEQQGGDGGAAGDASVFCTPDQLQAELDLGAVPLTESVWDSDTSDWDILNFGTHFQNSGEVYSGDQLSRMAENERLRNIGTVLTGMFIPPATAKYRFYVSGNDFAQLYINGQLVAESLVAVNTVTQSGKFYQYEIPAGGDGDTEVEGQPATKSMSSELSFTEDQPVSIEIRHGDHTGDSFFHVAVSHDSQQSTSAYQTVPTMLSISQNTVTINGERFSAPNNDKCDFNLARAIEKRFSTKTVQWHVLSEGVKTTGTNKCIYHVQIFRPQGKVEASGDGVSVVCEGNNNIYHDPIPLGLLRTSVPRSSGQATVEIKTNGLPAFYNETISSKVLFKYDSSKQVSVAPMSSQLQHKSWMRIAVQTTPPNQVIDPSNILIEIGGQRCLSGGEESDGGVRTGVGMVECRVPSLPAGGAHELSVHLGIYGTPINVQTTIEYPILVTAILPSEGSIHGGALITIQGQGFGTDAAVLIGGNPCIIKYHTLTELSCQTPAGESYGSVAIQITSGGLSVVRQSAYTYSQQRTLEVSSIEIHSSVTGTVQQLLSSGGNDTLILTSSGVQFPSKSLIDILLCSEGTTDTDSCRSCPVMLTGEVSTSSLVVMCRTPPTLSGVYLVRVMWVRFGLSNSNTLQTKFSLESYSPKTISNLGGAIMTFTGSGFTEKTHILMGPTSEVGLLCQHRSMSETEIVCQVESNTKQFFGSNTVRVYPSIEESYNDGLHAVCNNCSVTLTDQQPTRPSVTSVRGNGHSASVEISGRNLDLIIEVKAGTTVCDITSVSQNSVTCEMPQGVAGTYRLEVTATTGFSSMPDRPFYDFPVIITTPSSPYTGSYGGGHLFYLSGIGFSSNPSEVFVKIGRVECRVQESNLTHILVKTGNAYNSKDSWGDAAIEVTSHGIENRRHGVQYNRARNLTPRITNVETTSSNQMTITGTFPDTEVSSVYIGSVLCTVSSFSDTEVVCSFDSIFSSLPPVVNYFPIMIYPSGYSVQHSSSSTGLTLEINNVLHSESTISGSPFGGFDFYMTGPWEGVSNDDFTVSVCGIDADISSVTSSYVLMRTPAVLDPKFTLDAMRRGYFKKISKTVITDLTIKASVPNGGTSRNREAALMVDSDLSTSGKVQSWPLSTVILEEEHQREMFITELWYHPSDVFSVYRESQVNLTFYNSLTGGELIYNITTTPLTGWNKIILDSPATASVVRINLYRAAIGMTEIKLRGYILPGGITHRSHPGVSSSCPVNLTVSVPSPWPGIKSELYKYSYTVTYDSSYRVPVVNEFLPLHGTAAGGTTLQIMGSDLDGTIINTAVTIDGVSCAIQSQIASMITCITGERPEIPSEEQLGVVIRISHRGYALRADGVSDFFYADYWNSPLTWQGLQIPREGDTVILTRGRNVILNVSPPKLFFMLIDGGLIFDDSQDINLDLQYILIRGGRLQIGTKSAPFIHKATITLHGNRSTIPLPVYGTKNIAVRGGDVHLFGQPKYPTWTRLSATVDAGATSIYLRETPVNWNIGDEIVIAPGSYDFMEYEVRVIKSVVGNHISFDTPLRWHHFGDIEIHGGHSIDMSIEVGILTRNIVIQGDSESWRQKFGAHMIFHSPARHLSAQLHYVEYRRVGQAKIIGRYPIHFHLEGNRGDDVHVKGCSIHHSWNRAIVLHDTSYVTVENNVAFNAMGHMFFAEDGTEIHNTFQNNLGIAAKPTGGQLSHDVFTSVYWLANPQNNLLNNAAAGSSHMGFWVSPPKHPRRASFTREKCPSQLPLGRVFGNTAHSNGRHGFWVHPDHYARAIECGPPEEHLNPYVKSKVENLRSWKNGEQGLGFVDVGFYEITNIITIDNNDAGIEIGDVTGSDGAYVHDSVFVAHSRTNRPGEWRVFRGVTGYRGLITPKSEGFIGSRLTFIGFNQDITNDIGGSVEHAGVYTCCRCWNDCSSEMGSFTYEFSETTWIDTSNRVMFGWPHNDIIKDRDGTFTSSSAGSTLVPYHPHLQHPDCALGEAAHFSPSGFRSWTGRRNVPSLLCPSSHAFHRMILHSPKPDNQIYYRYNIESRWGITSLFFDESKDRTWTNGWAAPVFTSDSLPTSFRIWFAPDGDWEKLSVWVTEVEHSPFKSSLTLDFNYTGSYELFDVLSRRQGLQRNRKLLPFPEDSPVKVLPLNFISDEVSETLPTSTSMMDKDGNVISLRLKAGVQVSKPGRSQLVQMTPIPCATTDRKPTCIGMKPEDSPPQIFQWDDPLAWESGAVPSDNETVFIPKGRTILLSGSTARLQTLVIQGVLRCQDTGTDIEINANNIFVHSGLLEIGTVEEPFANSRVAINLRQGPHLAITRKHFLGSAVMAVFGQVSIHGKNIGSLWGKLGETALSGTTTITMQRPVSDWAVGGRIWISSTDYDSDNAEVRTIVSISEDRRTLTVDTPLANRHVGTTSDGFELRGEVGYLSHNIIISNPDEPSWGSQGPHVIFGEISSDPQFAGGGSVSFTEFANCGQFELDRGAFELLELTQNFVSVRSVSMWNNNAYAIRIDDLSGNSGFSLSDSVIYRSKQSTVQIKSKIRTPNVTISGNLIGNTEIEGDGKFDEHNCALWSTRYIKTTRNVVAGAWGEGFCIPGEPCNSEFASENEAHSCAHGFFATRYHWCSEMRGIRAWKNSYAGIFSMQTANFYIKESTFHDNHYAVNLIKTGSSRTKVGISDSTISGKSSSERQESCNKLSCVSHHGDPRYNRRDRCGDRTFEMNRNFNSVSMGILMSQSRISAKAPFMKRVIDLPLPYDMLGKVSYYGTNVITNVLFKNFVADACGMDAAFTTMGESRSHILPHEVSGARWENVDENSKFFFHNTAAQWRTGVQCGDGWDCSGLQQALIYSPDGTLHGQPPVEGQIARDAVISSLSGLSSNCVINHFWNAQRCTSATHSELFVRSQDPDGKDRRIYPLRVQNLNASGQPFYLVNQPPDKYMETEWPSFKRSPYFWAVTETNVNYRIDFGDLPPRRSSWELRNCASGQKVLLSIHYREPLRIQVWRDPSNNETGRAISSETPVTLSNSHAENYFWGSETRIIDVVMQCGKGFEIHQLLEVRVAMRLDMTIEEFYDKSDSKGFAKNIALLLGIPVGRIRHVQISAGSVVISFGIEAEDEQLYDSVKQQNELELLSYRLTNFSMEELSAAVGGPVSSVDSTLPGRGSCINGTADPTAFCDPIESGNDDFPSESWHIVIIVLCAVAVLVSGGVIAFLVIKPSSQVHPQTDESVKSEPEIIERPAGEHAAADFPDCTPNQPQDGSTPGDGDATYSPNTHVQQRPRLRSMKIFLEDEEEEETPEPPPTTQLVPTEKDTAPNNEA